MNTVITTNRSTDRVDRNTHADELITQNARINRHNDGAERISSTNARYERLYVIASTLPATAIIVSITVMVSFFIYEFFISLAFCNQFLEF